MTSVLTSLPPVKYEGKKYWLQRDLVRALNLGDEKYTPQRAIYYRRAMTEKLGRQWGSLLPVECRDGAVRKAWVVSKAEAEKFIDIRVRKIPSDPGADLRTICKSGRTYYPGIDIVRCAFPDVNQPDAYLSGRPSRAARGGLDARYGGRNGQGERGAAVTLHYLRP